MVNYESHPIRHERYYSHDDYDRQSLHPRTRERQLRRWDGLHSLEWIPFGKGHALPTRAVEYSTNAGAAIYIARARHAGSVTPGFFSINEKRCYIAWGGLAHKKLECEILCTPGEFVPCTTTNILLHGTPVGVSEFGEPLYIGRVKKETELVYGKVQRSHQVCYIPVDRKEKFDNDYEIFIKFPDNLTRAVTV
ncbi:uncharacterized protein LOC128723831 [Anopheles nili]|uniref:uncharacterized protein LOC128723831 n=1 Tax=Anopheles nili TaxID=185578 RepID=UPI00237BBD73|nr:uncharacterized protein LOC128723831 [Anopheles nili]